MHICDYLVRNASLSTDMQPRYPAAYGNKLRLMLEGKLIYINKINERNWRLISIAFFAYVLQHLHHQLLGSWTEFFSDMHRQLLCRLACVDHGYLQRTENPLKRQREDVVLSVAVLINMHLITRVLELYINIWRITVSADWFFWALPLFWRLR